MKTSGLGTKIVCGWLAVILAMSPVMAHTAYAWTWPWSKKTTTTETEATALTDDEIDSKINLYNNAGSSEKAEAKALLAQVETAKLWKILQEKMNTEILSNYSKFSRVVTVTKKYCNDYKEIKGSDSATISAEVEKLLDYASQIDTINKEVEPIVENYKYIDLLTVNTWDYMENVHWYISMKISTALLSKESKWKAHNVDSIFFTEVAGEEDYVLITDSDETFTDAGSYYLNVVLTDEEYTETDLGGFKHKIPVYLLVDDSVKFRENHDTVLDGTLEMYELCRKIIGQSNKFEEETDLVYYQNLWNGNNSSVSYGVDYDEDIDPNTPYYSDEGDTMDVPHIMIENSSTEYLTDSDVYFYTPNQLRYAKNEIYARHGRRFNDSELQAWFDAQSWYSGTVAPEDFQESVLSAIEKANIQVIQHRIEVNSQ